MSSQYSVGMLAAARSKTPALMSNRVSSSFNRFAGSEPRKQLVSVRAFSGTQHNAESNKGSAPRPSAFLNGKLRMALAIGGGGLALAGYTLSQYSSNQAVKKVEAKSIEPLLPTEAALKSVEMKHQASKAILDGLEGQERRDKIVRLDGLTDEEVDAILRAKEKRWLVESESSKVKAQVCTSQVSSNSPSEDYLTCSGLPSSTGSEKGKDSGIYMFGVFDGHRGHRCAEFLSKQIGPLFKYALSEIDKRLKDIPEDMDRLEFAIKIGFMAMDNTAVSDPIAKCREVIAQGQDLQKLKELVQYGVSGSCGLVVIVDTNAKEIVVGNVGDSRALVGVLQDDGTWKAVRLTEDQTGSTPSEIARIQNEHPGEDAVISGGRVLGNLMPSRAFGNMRFKWPLDIQQEIFPFLYDLGFNGAQTPKHCLTPPYVTAEPVVTRHKLSSNDKFMVLASDGLYDNLSDDQVVEAVAQWYEANKVTKNESAGCLAVKDSNAATHLIRAALSIDWKGTQGSLTARRLLAIPSPHSRRYRDDISATVVTLDME
ncbi:[Pyruvate dehydrogenase [acetyl-transferring]]-phosphatase 1, mitochondrial [Coemansia sp. RSA 2337]|nr:[Pyruvate dehydrogenase [acetyl-transferring]]-phosphatase 1, mitochondrial [Coemansia sp. S3946]KAJ2054227.1 [Pyruvate dehydrogenase [acetyl-transferring]]-phosphatase 1, mitochondrial [Coemansia sp. S16]KAJ2061500.1 [Pyruvate dehydrogenase [acetyl-transferring]]-phosphatase 1, mitochondrial [Coemansia sp. S2]KAJ2352029.1 [Pyruvate dehydrogenase [acetyl-transferring]]-phosphatase 1, mitochondrial [Coemansia sp. RSA 2673]KAJ2469463.1 [Pyruvate dehydrogenase [acetyl-transferring]]-phosphatase